MSCTYLYVGLLIQQKEIGYHVVILKVCLVQQLLKSNSHKKVLRLLKLHCAFASCEKKIFGDGWGKLKKWQWQRKTFLKVNLKLDSSDCKGKWISETIWNNGKYTIYQIKRDCPRSCISTRFNVTSSFGKPDGECKLYLRDVLGIWGLQIGWVWRDLQQSKWSGEIIINSGTHS